MRTQLPGKPKQGRGKRSRPSSTLVTGFAVLVVLAALGTEASAQVIPVARVTAGYGFNDAYGPGIGGSAGIEIPFIRDKRFFVGGRGMYHFGSEGELPGFATEDASVPTGDVTQFQAGLEIGATWMASPVYIRTVGGVGLSRVDLSIDSGTSALEGTNTKLQYGPGLLIGLPSESGTIAGVEIRWLKVKDLDSSLAVYLTFGRRFL